MKEVHHGWAVGFENWPPDRENLVAAHKMGAEVFLGMLVDLGSQGKIIGIPRWERHAPVQIGQPATWRNGWIGWLCPVYTE